MRWLRAHRVGSVMLPLVLALTAAGIAVPSAQAHTSAASAVTAVTTADIGQSGPDQQRWLSAPQSRIVLNPYDNGRGTTDGQQTLSSGYYAHDKALKTNNLVNVYRATAAQPPAPTTTASYTADFRSLGTATSTWSATGVTGTAGSDGSALLTLGSAQPWGNISQSVTVQDAAATPELTVTVPRTTGKWALKINTGGSADAYTLQNDTAETGTFTYDLRALTGWTGSHTFTLKLYAVGAGTTTTVRSLSVHTQPPFPDAGQNVGFADDFTSAAGWAPAAGSQTTVTSSGGYGTVTLGSTSGFGAVERSVTVDLTANPLLSLRVSASTAKWALKINTGGADDAFTVQQDTSRAGTFSYDLASLTGWTGTHTFKLKLFQVGAQGTTTTVDRISAHSGSPWLQTASSFGTTWSPQSLGFTGTYGGSGSLNGTDVFHGADAVTRLVDARLTSGAAAVTGAFSAGAAYDAARRVLTVTQPDFSYAVALPAGGSVRFFGSQADLRFGANGDTVPPGTSGYWSVTLPATGTYAVGIGFAVGGSGSSASATSSALAAATVSGARSDISSWTGYWNTYLARVPVPQDFALHSVSADGVTAADIESSYYRAWVNLEENILPATPETGNAYAQLGTGKASLWMNGTPGTKEVASWDSLLGMQDLVYTDPANAWASFQGMMALVDSDGKLGGESLPSRKAQTAWILYQVTGDSGKLASTYDALSRHLTWESQNLRWILGGYDHPDERDSEFVSSLIVDLGYAQQIAQSLAKDADLAKWADLRAGLIANYRSWFFPSGGGTVQKVFLNGSQPADPGLTMYTSTGLHIKGLGSSYVNTLTTRFMSEYDPGAQFAGLAAEAIKAPDAQFMTYGLLDQGQAGQANVLVNALTRDMVRSGTFAEVYQAAPDGTGTPIARGVSPSLFGIANLIDNVWMNNGYRLDVGGPAFVRLSPDDQGGITGLTYQGRRLDIDLNGTTVQLRTATHGACAVLHPAVGRTVTLARACGSSS